MTSVTGRECRIPGIYRSYCCGYEVALSARVSYPRCPRCAKWATWLSSSSPLTPNLGAAHDHPVSTARRGTRFTIWRT
jgi:hypothetical protein